VEKTATFGTGETGGSGGGAGDLPADGGARRGRWSKLWKRAGFGMVGIVAILLVVFFLLPVWLSNEQGRTYVLQRINSHLRAKIQVEDWSLGWFRGTELKNVSITLPDGTQMLICPRVESDLTLWGILWGRYDVGNMKVDTAQVKLTKYADGSHSILAVVPEGAGPGMGMAKLLQTLRGSLQVGSAVVTVNSVATGESLTYTDVKAAVTIASPEAPFHVMVSAVGSGEGGAGERNLSFNATLPALASGAPGWSMAADMELTAVNVPTGLACDWVGEDPRWSDSLGKVLERVRFSNHETPPLETSRPIVEIRGTEGAYVDGRFLLKRAVGNGEPATLTLPGQGGFWGVAVLRVSAPLADLLKRVNPVFGMLERGDGPVKIMLTDLSMPADAREHPQATWLVTFPPMVMARKGVLADLLKLGQDPEGQGETVTATAAALKVRVADGVMTYDNFTMIFGSARRQQRVTFGGTVGIDGTLNLMATVPAAGWGGKESLESSTANVPLTGTVGNPVVRLPG
jgi:hypothetical protein